MLQHVVVVLPLLRSDLVVLDLFGRFRIFGQRNFIGLLPIHHGLGLVRAGQRFFGSGNGFGLKDLI